MISINQNPIPWGVWSYGGIFPSSETKATAPIISEKTNTIVYRWDPANGEGELIHLFYIMKFIKTRAPEAKNTLVMEYIPNARLDKKLGADFDHDIELLPLNEYTADFINSLGFDKVIGIEPHSNEFLRKYKNSVAEYPTMNALELIRRRIGYRTEYQLVFPDEGSFNRYKEEIMTKPRYREDYIVIKKKRINGEVCDVGLEHGELNNEKNIIIIDDICSKGSTALGTAQILLDICKQFEFPPKEIFLLVAYLEKSAAYTPNGVLSDDSPFTKIFVAGPNPFETIQNPKVEYIPYTKTFVS